MSYQFFYAIAGKHPILFYLILELEEGAKIDFGEKERERGKEVCLMPCLSLGLGVDRRSIPRGFDVSLALFNNFGERKQKPCRRSFPFHFFRFRRLPGFRLTFKCSQKQ